ncbi:MAG: AEC family transporter [Clostridia bacterium]|nr:AEC family transporter [Clostridia bacterium]
MIIFENSDTVMARLETYVFVPALSLYTMITQCTVQTFAENSKLILYGLIINLVAIIAAYPLSAMFIRKSSASPEKAYSRNVYKYAMAYGNYGFMGNFIILGVWGDAMFYKYTMFTFLVAILCSSWGLYILIPKEQNEGLWHNLKKALITPPIIALVAGIIIGLSGLSRFVPDFLITAFNNAGQCQGPVAMLLAGFVIGGYDFKKLLLNKKVYIATALRLVVLPAILMVILKLLGASEELMVLALVLSATPLGLNTIVYPAAYGGETQTGASMATISHTLSVITIPLMYLLFIVIL